MTATLFIENVCDYDISWLIIYFLKLFHYWNSYVY